METILIIEDNDDYRELLKESLSSEYLIVEASNIEASKEAIKSIKPDLVLLDLVLGSKYSENLYWKLKEDSKHWVTPVLIISGGELTDSLVEGIQKDNLLGFVNKPASMDFIKTRIYEMLKKAEKVIVDCVVDCSQRCMLVNRKRVLKRIVSSRFIDAYKDQLESLKSKIDEDIESNETKDLVEKIILNSKTLGCTFVISKLSNIRELIIEKDRIEVLNLIDIAIESLTHVKTKACINH